MAMVKALASSTLISAAAPGVSGASRQRAQIGSGIRTLRSIGSSRTCLIDYGVPQSTLSAPVPQWSPDHPIGPRDSPMHWCPRRARALCSRLAGSRRTGVTFDSSRFRLRGCSHYGLQVEVQERLLLVALLLILFAHADHLAQNFDVEAVALGFEIDFL